MRRKQLKSLGGKGGMKKKSKLGCQFRKAMRGTRRFIGEKQWTVDGAVEDPVE